MYITAALGDSITRTSTKWNNENPEFDESLDIWVPKGKALDDITISVFDDDRFTNEDDPLGSTKFNLASRREESNDFELKMEGEMAGECVVTLTATFLPFGGAAGVPHHTCQLAAPSGQQPIAPCAPVSVWHLAQPSSTVLV